MGDFNGHIGNILGRGVPGNSDDINQNGTRFLNFLTSCNLQHLNGTLRVPGDPNSKICSGLWTRQRADSRSVIDFIVLSAEHMDTVVSMNVDDSGTYGGGSDHNWCWATLKDKFRTLTRRSKPPHKQKRWDIKVDHDF